MGAKAACKGGRMTLAQEDAYFVEYLRRLAEGKSYEARGYALTVLTCLQRKSELARSFVRRVRTNCPPGSLDGIDNFAFAAREAKQVLDNLKSALAEEPGAAEPEATPAPPASAKVVRAAAPSTKLKTRKFLL